MFSDLHGLVFASGPGARVAHDRSFEVAMNGRELPTECSLCSRRVARFWVQCAIVSSATPDGSFQTELGISGFCLNHRDAVAEKLAAEVQSSGVLLMESAIELRAHEVEPFLLFVQERLAGQIDP